MELFSASTSNYMNNFRRHAVHLLRGKGLLGKCLSSHGYHQVLTYQPDGRFWTFQWMEAGIFVLLAAFLPPSSSARRSHDARRSSTTRR